MRAVVSRRTLRSGLLEVSSWNASALPVPNAASSAAAMPFAMPRRATPRERSECTLAIFYDPRGESSGPGRRSGRSRGGFSTSDRHATPPLVGGTHGCDRQIVVLLAGEGRVGLRPDLVERAGPLGT